MFRVLALSALPFLLAAQGPVPIGTRDPGRFSIAADAEARWTSFELTPGNQVRFEMEVDGRPAIAILDTGVSHSVLSRKWAGLDPARVQQGERATAIGGKVATGWVPTETVRIAGVTRTGGGLVVAALPAMATGGARAVDLLVGRDLLAPYALDIDYAAKRFRLLPSGRMPFRGATAPLTISSARQVYESELGLGGRRVRPVVVDTGDGSSVTVTRAEWDAARLSGLPTTTAIAFGLGGPAVTDMAIVPELRIGQLTARNVELRVEAAGGFSQSIGAAGRIGSGLLGNYRVLLDPGAGRMVLSPGPKADQPPLRSTSGLLLGVLPDRIRVLHVMRNGPGAAAGWKNGDEICAVDGVTVTRDYPSSPLATWSAGEPGRVVRLRTCAGEERTLALKRFY